MATLFASLGVADDFKTFDGKEFKNATVRRVEPDGIVVSTKGGISKLYFNELPSEVQKQFHYEPEKQPRTALNRPLLSKSLLSKQRNSIGSKHNGRSNRENRQPSSRTFRRLPTPIRTSCNKRKSCWQQSDK